MARHCGAKTRAGGKCKAPAMANGRCRVHGGASTGPKEPAIPKGNTRAVSHGFYSDALLAEERPLYERAEIGSLDDEIRLAKVKLFRFVRMSGNSDVAEMVDGAIEIVRKFGDDKVFGAYDKQEIKAAAPNYSDLIIRQLDVVRKLESARMKLHLGERMLAQDAEDGDREVVGFEMVAYEDDDEA